MDSVDPAPTTISIVEENRSSTWAKFTIISKTAYGGTLVYYGSTVRDMVREVRKIQKARGMLDARPLYN